jgi:hypothetical protein
MRRLLGWRLAALSSVCLAGGCAASQGVRYVYQDGDFGVVGMPENSDVRPTHYRSRAEKLMDAHFPEGHEIVRAEEVIAGDRTLKVEESRTAEMLPHLPSPLLNLARIGGSESVTQADSIKIKECRILYRRTSASEKPEGYAAASGLNPSQYIDPNDAIRRKSGRKKPDEVISRDDFL